MKNLIDPKGVRGYQFHGAGHKEGNTIAFPCLGLMTAGAFFRSAMYLKYQDAIRAQKNKFNAEVEKFLAQYPQHVEEAKEALKEMFNPSDYPSIAELRGKFGMKIHVAPLPCGSDFRVTLASDELASIQQDVDQRVQDATAQAVKDLWQRLGRSLCAIWSIGWRNRTQFSVILLSGTLRILLTLSQT